MKMPFAIRFAPPVVGQLPHALQALSRRLALWAMLLLAAAGAANAQKTIPKPTQQLVNDFAGLLSADQRARLSNKLNAYARETSIQIAVVTEASLEGDEIFDYTVRLAQEWGIGGDDQKDNGILVYIARDERKMRIQTGYGAEGFLPDARAKRIIADIMTPAFREGNYYAGIDQATTAIMDFGRGEEYTAEEGSQSSRQAKGFPVWLILGFIVGLVLLIIFLSNRNGKGRGKGDNDSGYDRNGRYDMDRYARRPRQPARQHHQPQRNTGGGGGGWFIFPFPGTGGGGGGSWGGGDSGGGDFGGFGGGDFGGGGAGGDW